MAATTQIVAIMGASISISFFKASQCKTYNECHQAKYKSAPGGSNAYCTPGGNANTLKRKAQKFKNSSKFHNHILDIMLANVQRSAGSLPLPCMYG